MCWSGLNHLTSSLPCIVSPHETKSVWKHSLDHPLSPNKTPCVNCLSVLGFFLVTGVVHGRTSLPGLIKAVYCLLAHLLTPLILGLCSCAWDSLNSLNTAQTRKSLSGGIFLRVAGAVSCHSTWYAVKGCGVQKLLNICSFLFFPVQLLLCFAAAVSGHLIWCWQLQWQSPQGKFTLTRLRRYRPINLQMCLKQHHVRRQISWTIQYFITNSAHR